MSTECTSDEKPDATPQEQPSSISLLGQGGGAGTMLGLLHGGGAGVGNIAVPAPFSRTIMLIPETRVAGTTHVLGIDRLSEELRVGERLTLERDAHNAYDDFAIKVLTAGGERLGFLACDCNQIPARLMDAGKVLFATVEAHERRGNWHKISVSVHMED